MEKGIIMKKKIFIVIFILGSLFLVTGIFFQIKELYFTLHAYHATVQGIDVNCTIKEQNKQADLQCVMKNQTTTDISIEQFIFYIDLPNDVQHKYVFPIQALLKAKKKNTYRFTLEQSRKEIEKITFQYE